MNNAILALDIGATKIAIATLTSEFKIVDADEVRIAQSTNLWGALERKVKEILHRSEMRITSIGIASAGPINRRLGSISPVNIPDWKDFQIADQISSLLPRVPIFLLGDAIAVALAEKRVGAGMSFNNMLGMVISTGIGGGLVINDQVIHGELGNAGFFGHHVIDLNGERCRCGRNGCVESFASGPRMVSSALKQGWIGEENFEALAASAREGDELAIRAIDIGAKALAIGITNVLAILDISAVVVGGGVAQAGEIYWSKLLAHIATEERHISLAKAAVVVPARLGTNAGIIGAALATRE